LGTSDAVWKIDQKQIENPSLGIFLPYTFYAGAKQVSLRILFFILASD
jgi:hypothetical protein